MKEIAQLNHFENLTLLPSVSSFLGRNILPKQSSLIRDIIALALSKNQKFADFYKNNNLIDLSLLPPEVLKEID